VAAFFVSPGLKRAMVNDRFRQDLCCDMLTKSPMLRTVAKGWFQLWCFLQNIVLLGWIGALIGGYLEEGQISRLHLAIVSAFLAVFAGQSLAYLRKKPGHMVYGHSLALAQMFVGVLLFLPLKAALSEHQVAALLVEKLGDFSIGDWGVDAVLMSIAGTLFYLVSNCALGSTSES
jgi:hypothetical protein